MLVVFKSENPEDQSMTVIEVELYFYQDLNILLIFFSTCLELIFYKYRLGKAKKLLVDIYDSNKTMTSTGLSRRQFDIIRFAFSQ